MKYLFLILFITTLAFAQQQQLSFTQEEIESLSGVDSVLYQEHINDITELRKEVQEINRKYFEQYYLYQRQMELKNFEEQKIIQKLWAIKKKLQEKDNDRADN